MADPMDREMTYALLFEEVALYKTSVESDLYTSNELELLVRISALTDAILYEKLSISEGRHLLRQYIESLKAPPPEPEKPEPAEGSIKF